MLGTPKNRRELMKIEEMSVTELRFDDENARLHPEHNRSLLRASLEKFGQRKPIVVTTDNRVIAGNGTLLAATELGWEKISVVRAPEDWTDEMIRAFAIADNRASDLSEFDPTVLQEQLDSLKVADFDFDALGFNEIDLRELGEVSLTSGKPQGGSEDGHSYTPKIAVPQYEIVGDEPQIFELYDTTRSDALQDAVDKAKLPEDIAEFLRIAAYRHTVFNYEKIAEYYPHAPAKIQRLIEASALVIIDSEDAIKQGFATFQQALTDLIEADHDAE